MANLKLPVRRDQTEIRKQKLEYREKINPTKKTVGTVTVVSKR